MVSSVQYGEIGYKDGVHGEDCKVGVSYFVVVRWKFPCLGKEGNIKGFI